MTRPGTDRARLDRGRRRAGALRLAAACLLAGGFVAGPTDAWSADEPAASAADDGTAMRRPVAPDFSTDVAMRQHYGLAALEIVGFDVLLNQANRRWSGSSDYDSNLKTIHRNLRSHWGVDNDPFDINQLAHPYQGSIYHTIARSAGLSYWESAAYTFGGSVFWEIAGEKTRPSANDQVASGIGGSFLGEALFRMSNLLIEDGGGSTLWREVGAALISPATSFNRLSFDRYGRPLLSKGKAEYYSRFQVGVSRSAENDAGLSATPLKRNEAIASFAIDYGLPGKAGYEYEKPFDYFAFEASTSSANGFESVMTRGSLFARAYEAGPDYRGILGVFGSYDYIAPQTFRVSTTALSLGSVAQWNATPAVRFQGSGLLGAGYAAVGTVRSIDGRDYQYGVAPQALVALRMIVANRFSADFTGREYFVSRVAAADRGGHETITRLDAALTWLVTGRHALSLKYLGNRRDVDLPDLGSRRQTRGTVGVYYTWLGQDRFADFKF